VVLRSVEVALRTYCVSPRLYLRRGPSLRALFSYAGSKIVEAPAAGTGCFPIKLGLWHFIRDPRRDDAGDALGMSAYRDLVASWAMTHWPRREPSRRGEAGGMNTEGKQDTQPKIGMGRTHTVIVWGERCEIRVYRESRALLPAVLARAW
jgi:hypothetical protein